VPSLLGRVFGRRELRRLEQRTRDLGVDGVEFDVHVAHDGELVVIHDPTLERTTEGQGVVAERTAAELGAIPLRDGGGEGVPRLDAVLEVFAGTRRVKNRNGRETSLLGVLGNGS
jgi:glycerophosphoryl diester phosphodiesterase